jgi:hypothetical protein
VGQVVANEGEGAAANAYDHLLFSVAVYLGVYAKLWPIVVGTLLRRADAREAASEGNCKEDLADDAANGELLLARLLYLEPIDINLCAPWIDRIFAVIVHTTSFFMQPTGACMCPSTLTCPVGILIQASEKSPVGLKIVLLEYLGTNRSAPDSMDMIPFLLDRIKHEPHDKTRACAVLALGIMFRFVFIATDHFTPPKWALLVALRGGEKN